MNQTETYKTLLQQLASLTEDCRYVISNCANTAALICHTLPDLNWAGFYLMADGVLQLGPFCGKPACLRIPLGRGVCGTAAQNRKTELVKDVHLFPGHIACDSASNSEIVIPMVKGGILYGVLDIDSPVKNRFDETDRYYLEKVVSILLTACHWESFHLG